ncbi:unnamed protein product [Nezara viridula]|uniref:phytanoyl-CoA dioxygenase n=1 Tax=Nezara viridula TaxID=85310 RepID=A0A9P0HAN3_NEZVI|nr:unnamed protein product [Nezara viridula]
MASRRLEVLKRHLNNNNLSVKLCSAESNLITDKEFNYTVNHGALSQSERRFYETNGYIIKPDLFDEELLDSFSSRFIDYCEGRIPKGNITLMKDISLAKKGATGQYLYNKAQDILYDEVFEKYLFHEKLLEIVECFTGPNIKAVNSMLINKPPDSGTLTSRHPLHQDLHYFPFRPADRIVGAWTALEDVNIENGCLIVIPGSHKSQLLPHEYPKWEGGVNKAYHGIQDYNIDEVIPIIMKKGETIFFHPQLIHGSGPNTTKGFRKAISGHFAASECYYIDLKGTTQENIAVEVEEMARKRGTPLNIQEIWYFKGRVVRGEERTL